MAQNETPHPPIVSQGEWRAARLELLAHEKELTKHHDRVSAERRRLPMVQIDKDYRFDGSEGKRSLPDLFDGCRQLIVYHFMFDPRWEKGCPGCTGFVNALGDLSMLAERDTRFLLVSRAPLEKLQAYKDAEGWDTPWYSSFGSDFNSDFNVTHDENTTSPEYNYRSEAEIRQARGNDYSLKGENHGLSVFFRTDGGVFHTYSTYARGVESLTDAYPLLDTTPYGRQEDWEESPPGWPQKPTYG